MQSRPLFTLGLLSFYSKACISNKRSKNKLHLLRKTNVFFINSKNKKINDKFVTLTKLTLTILDNY